MDKGQFAILRFAKYKGPEIANIEAHNERTKEKYASNPDVDTNRSKNNFHIIQPTDKYRANCAIPTAIPPKKERKRVMGIEPTYTAWKAVILPLNYTRVKASLYMK